MSARCTVAAILLAWAAALLFSDAPYLHDFGEWLYQGEILKHLVIDPGVVPGYSVHPYPVPNSLVVVLLAIGCMFLPAVWAGKLFLFALLACWVFVIRRFCAQYVEEPLRARAMAFLLPTLALATFHWYGFVSYQLGLLLFIWFLSAEEHETRAASIAVFSIALFFAHGAMFLVFGLYMTLNALLRRDIDRLLALLPAGLLSAWFVLGRQLTGFAAPVAGSEWSGLTETLIYKLGYPAMLGPFKNLLREDGSSLLETQSWIYWSGFVTNFTVIAMIGVFALFVFWSRRELATAKQCSGNPRESALYLTAIALLLAYLIAPYNFFGLFNPGGRLLLPLILILVILGRAHFGKLLTLVFWPVAIFTTLTCCSYLVLTLPNDQGYRIETKAPRHSSLPGNSVLEFNDALYANTRFKYFNHRIFAFAYRFPQIERKSFAGPGLSVGPLAWQAQNDN